MRLGWLVLLAGCSGSTTKGDEVPPDPKGWTITIDASATERYVAPETETSWTVKGTTRATEGVASIDVGGMPAVLEGDAFSQTVAVAPGTTRVPILVRDQAGHERKAVRTLMATRFLVDGAHNTSAASLVLDNAILAAMSGGIAGQAGDVNVAAEIMAKDVLSQDDRCVTWPTSAQQGTVAVELTQDLGNLWLHITVPNLDVRFGGQCQGLLSTIPIAGRMAGTLHVWSRLTAKPPANGECIDSFAHTMPEVQVSGWQFDVWGVGGPLQNWIVDMFAGEKSAEAKAQIASEVKTRANTMLGEKLANISVFDKSSDLSLLDKPVSLHLCLGGLEKIGTQLVARVAASAIGPGGSREAPGAPQVEGAALNPAAKELVLDANLVAQLLYASWRDGGLARTASDVDIGILQILMPELYDRWPDATTAQVAIDAELPPLVRASTSTNDMTIELADLIVTLSVEGTMILKFNVGLTLVMDLVPTAGKLSPKVIDTRAEVTLVDELYDGNDAALEQAVASQIGGAASGLLGDSAAIALPDLPGLGAPVDVVPDAGGRFLRIKL